MTTTTTTTTTTATLHPTTALARAEWTKWRSTMATVRYGGAAVGLSVLITGLLALAMNQAHDACARPGATCSQPPLIAPDTVVTAGLLGDGTPGAGLIALMLLGAATMLVEHRHGTLARTFLLAPRRWTVVAIKAGLTVVVSFGLALVATILSAVVFVTLGGGAAQELDPWSTATLSIGLRSAAVVAVAALGAVGLAALLRHAVVVAATIVAWPLVIEPLLPSLLPGSGATAAGLLPFVNARRFISLGAGDATFLWGQTGSGLYFAATMLTLLGIGAAVVQRRSP